MLITIGACATSGGIQALKNFKDVNQFINIVYANPAYIETLQNSTPIEDHVSVDFELRGCPINKNQLIEICNAYLNRRKPNISSQPLCMECKKRGNVCVMVSKGIPCLGPVTHDGCDAICPAYNRGCYSCFGPSDDPNVKALSKHFRKNDISKEELIRMYRGFNANSEEFKYESIFHEKQ
jgi:coenzyme F420-reducing hydrogenase gamma subunit